MLRFKWNENVRSFPINGARAKEVVRLIQGDLVPRLRTEFTRICPTEVVTENDPPRGYIINLGTNPKSHEHYLRICDLKGTLVTHIPLRMISRYMVQHHGWLCRCYDDDGKELPFVVRYQGHRDRFVIEASQGWTTRAPQL